MSAKIKKSEETFFIENLGKRGEKILAENLSEDEEIKAKIKGTHGEAFVITNKRLYVLKWGFVAGSMFGGRCNSFDFKNIVGIELNKGPLTGTVEIITPATQSTKANYWNNQSSKSDNIVTFTSNKFGVFGETVKMGREMIEKSNRHKVDYSKKENYLDEIERLAELKEKKVITEEEFQNKKKEILGQSRG